MIILDARHEARDHACGGTWQHMGKNRGGHDVYQCTAADRPHRIIEAHMYAAHTCRMEEECSEAITRDEWLQAESRKVCQKIADAYKAVAYAENHHISSSQGAIYRTMRAAMITAIREVYMLSPVKAWRVYDVMIDSGEDVAYCVRFVKANPGRHGSSAYEH